MKRAHSAVEHASRSSTAEAVLSRRAARPETGPRRASRGQVLVIFAGALVTLLSLSAVVIDVSWYWANTLRVQRAADAAALAGVVSLPGDIPGAQATAAKAAGQNGYALTNACKADNRTPSSVPGICAQPDSANNRQLDVAVSAPVNTFFMRLLGINSITASRTAKARYELPVPMGSPLNYYGVYQLCSVAGVCSAQPGATSASVSSQGFFGAIEGEGTNRSTGDAFATYYNPKSTKNDQYNAKGYDYTTVVPTGNATIWIFDPTFCATATKTTGSGHAGAGDHWLGPNDPTPVSTYYQLWNFNGFPLDANKWTQVPGADSGTLFESENQLDKSTTYGSTTLTNYADQGTPSGVTDCQAGKISNQAVGGYWHNKWWPLATNVAAGTYFVRVMTTDPNDASANLGQSFENMFSIEVTGGGAGQIYGGGKMETYANVDSGSQTFYLAQISKILGAGKTMEIDLFDPGDVGQNAWLQILSPDGNKVEPNDYANFSFTADTNASGPQSSGGTVNCIQTYRPSGGGSVPPGCTTYASTNSTGTFYQNSWVKILVPIPGTYGQTGLHPSTDPAGQDGWWKIKYTVQSANDTTTWMVSVLGNPVHLVVP
jgi:Flp pilus assembly protein TadG